MTHVCFHVQLILNRTKRKLRILIGPAKNGDINIIPNTFGSGSTGRIEIFLQGSWQTVCDKNFTKGAANVVCQQAGWGRASSFSSFYKSGTGKIGLVNVRCTGLESSLLECPYDSSNVESVCNHNDDVGVSCYQCKLNSF